MKKQKFSFVTLSPECSNIELVKDVGQIPYILGRDYPVETSVVACDIDLNGENLENVHTLNLVRIPFLFHSTEITGLVYLLKHARKIDWLSLHHAGRRSLYWARFYKFLNPRGKVYLKLDLDFRSCQNYDASGWERGIFMKNTKIMDLITVESTAVKVRIQKYSQKELKLLANGYVPYNESFLQKKENVFFTAGRLGTRQKATEILLEAFARYSDEHDWILKLAGPVTLDFQKDILLFYERHPHLRERVVFTGNICDRKTLYQEYERAKVFVLPSRWESFGIVLPEAMSHGCYLIGSDQIPPFDDMTENGKYGIKVKADDIDDLAEAMLKATDLSFNDGIDARIREHARKNYSWDSICHLLYHYLLEAGESK